MSDNQQKLNELVSVHLGKAGDGTVVKPYVTPDIIDRELMVSVPRVLNREQYGITDDTVMFGYDVWHAYEFSTLTPNGFPVSGTLKWAYSSKSDNIIESKSAKLYLNSFNMFKWERACDVQDVKDESVERFIDDFEEKIGTVPYSNLFTDDWEPEVKPFTVNFTRLEDVVDVFDIPFTAYNEDPNLLEIVPGSRLPFAVTTSALRSNCRVTNQPDWGDVYVYINGGKHITPESLLQYVVSMRKENHFHEEICECIYKRLLDMLDPDDLFVSCLYTRRGGIDINPVRANSYDLIYKIASPLVESVSRTAKTMRQ